MSPGDVRSHLQNLLDDKEKQLQNAGTLGQQLLAQRMELEERIRQLQEAEMDAGSDDEDAETSVREKYRDLADTVKQWETENEQLSFMFTGSKADPQMDLTREVERVDRSSKAAAAAAAGPSAAQSSRRAKNAAHRADDVEFAFEIGSGLLTEVRRLQSLLGERDKAIQDMKEEKDDLDKTIESLRTALRQQEQSADRFKEENWNLEVTMQELRTQHGDAQASVVRLEGEHKRLTKILASAREAADQHKNEAERQQHAYEDLKAKHETDVAQARKHAASLQRDKSDLQQALDSMKTEVAKGNRRFPRFGSPLTPNGAAATDTLTPSNIDEDDVFGTTGRPSTNNRKNGDATAFYSPEAFDDTESSPEPSPSKPFLAPNHPSNEIEALQQRLAHAQRQINTLKGSLQREKELKIEYRRKLDAGGEAEEVEEPKAKPRLTPYRAARGRGRGRGRGGLTLIQRLGMAANSPEPRETSPPPPVPPLPAAFPADEDASPSPPQPNSNRVSVDGMDPAFANILRRSNSASSLPMNGSPLRQSVMAIAARGGTLPRRSRGGAAYQEARPPSLVGAPEALAAELGLGFGGIIREQEQDTLRAVETAEFGCQAGFEDVVTPPPPIQITPAMSEMGIQVEPEPAPVVQTVDQSMQTEAIFAPARTDSGIQYDIVQPERVLVSSAMGTEPIVVAPEQAEVLPMPTLVQTGVQTPRTQSVEINVQTSEEPVRALPEMSEMDVQTMPPATVEVQTQTSLLVSADAQVQAMESEVPYIRAVDMSVGTSYGDSSGDTTVHGRRPASLAFSQGSLDEDMATETGSTMDSITENYQSAHEGAVIPTPTDSNDDFYSIRTVSDNDFSETDDDNESVVASRLPSHLSAVSSTFSFMQPSPSTSSPVITPPTYDSKAVETEVVEEVPVQTVPIAAVTQPKPEVREISIQTDDWVSPPAAVPAVVPITAPPTPAPIQPPPLYLHLSTVVCWAYTTSMPPVAAPSPNTTIRDSNATFIARPRTSHSDRRQSIESTLSSIMDDISNRARTPSVIPAVIDKTRPPMMTLPPPPRAPPPPNSMLPPAFIPDKRLSQDAPPPRPSSPPPPELIQRATTPLGSVLSVPGARPFGLRQHGSSMPPSQNGLRELPSTSSFRSAANAASRAPLSSPTPSTMSFGIKERRERSTTSLNSGGHSLGSQRSSISSDHHGFQPSQRLAEAGAVGDRSADVSARTAAVGSTDPTVIHAITQTMIGEFLYKYTRRTIGKGPGNSRHKRFVWIHPYTRTLYWSSADPGSSNVAESSAKSAYIEGVRSVLDPNPMPPGIHQYSVVVSTPQREMKFTAPTKDRHDIWLNALKYLLTRPSAIPANSPGGPVAAPLSPMSIDRELPDDEPSVRPNVLASPQSQRSTRTGRTALSADSWNVTPRGQRSRSQISLGGSIGKRAGTPAAEYLRWSERGEQELLHSPTKDYEHIPGPDDGELDFELHDETMSDGGFEGLENVRACCDGRHTVGRSGIPDHHHHHHHHHDHDHLHREPSRTLDQHLHAAPKEMSRPSSPAWSFRSRAGSSTSHEGAGFFSRFGTKRSTRAVQGVFAGAQEQY
ncbi:uncharacterized protein B0H18DRAFT_982108 [Fomitopsis serialis]|uniref:uncharacterized protein n=1 Tax=Fomitopsis serialis TaxID=139415 RepID=UPI0020077EBC|nr:uncharacterized protein B0H18DRAFT_982108 [Neoantrodia serialis]KAH9933802.1 hypothetical protein B0H18DRAFT_982108 [Neoantrodia serialis]